MNTRLEITELSLFPIKQSIKILPILKIVISPYYSSWQKRLFDIVMSLSGLIVLWPVFLAISLLILLMNGWPVFFFQKRFGKNQKTFTIIKFRTMKKNAEQKRKSLLHLNQAPLPMFKISDDPRYTTLGKFLSRAGLDELPQLINILIGEMSFVGPRPLPTVEAKNLPKSWAFRFKVQPGLLSEWAINSHRYASLRTWKKLEEETLINAKNFTYDLGLFFQAIKYLMSDK